MENPILYVTFASIALNAILVIGLIFFAYKLLKVNEKLSQVEKKAEIMTDVYEESQMEQVRGKVETVSFGSVGDYCVDHPSEVSIGQCAISGNAYCQHCLKSFQGIKIGKKFLDLYVGSKWEEFLVIPKEDLMQEIDPDIISAKQSLWDESNIPVIIQNHYKINIQDDSVESFTVLQGRVDDLELLRAKFTKSGGNSIQ